MPFQDNKGWKKEKNVNHFGHNHVEQGSNLLGSPCPEGQGAASPFTL